jgi:septin family protein
MTPFRDSAFAVWKMVLWKVKLLQAMKHLHDKVNVIPVIGKSDACTQDEIRRFKSAVSFSE